MSKLICLIAPAPHSFYFVNRLHDAFGVSLVVVEEGTGPRDPLHRRLRRIASPPAAVHALRNRLRRSGRREVALRMFGPSGEALDPEIEVMHVSSVNAPEVLDRLAAEAPDVLADHGTSIVRDPILETAKVALNLHWGLSPYYRGVRCTEWALINWDPYNIGVTIHELTRQIDGGSIWAQQRATVTEADDVHSLNMQLSKLGTDLILRVVAALAARTPPPARAQRREIGLLTLSRQWTPHLSAQISHIERSGVLARMLQHPARRALPIVEIGESTGAVVAPD